jgi:hypothetical protein
MSGLWLVSYIFLWVFVIGLCLVVVGLLQQVGVLQHQLAQSGGTQGPFASPVPLPEDDGPALGASLPEQSLETFNGFGTLVLPDPHGNKEDTMPSCV